MIAFNAGGRGRAIGWITGCGMARCSSCRLLSCGLSWVDRFFDEYVVNSDLMKVARGLAQRRPLLSRLQNGQRAELFACDWRCAGRAGAALDLGVHAIMNAFPMHHHSDTRAVRSARDRPYRLLVGRCQTRWLAAIAPGLQPRSALGARAVVVERRSTSSPARFQFERHDTIGSQHLGVEYLVGVDGLGLLMVLLTAIVVPMAMLASWRIERAAVPLFRAGAVPAGRTVRHLHRAELLPLVYLLGTEPDPGIFPDQTLGRAAARAPRQRNSSSTPWSAASPCCWRFWRFFWRRARFDFIELAELARTGSLAPALDREAGAGFILAGGHCRAADFRGVFLGLRGQGAAVPVSHLAARRPTPKRRAGTTMLLTGVMSKMGVYGFLRILLPIFPSRCARLLTPLLWLAVVTIVFSACAAFAQRDLKRIFAYSSINHLGYCLLGIFAVVKLSRGNADPAAERAAALNGVILQMFNHGLTAATLFWFIGFFEQRSGDCAG